MIRFIAIFLTFFVTFTSVIRPSQAHQIFLKEQFCISTDQQVAQLTDDLKLQKDVYVAPQKQKSFKVFHDSFTIPIILLFILFLVSCAREMEEPEINPRTLNTLKTQLNAANLSGNYQLLDSINLLREEGLWSFENYDQIKGLVLDAMMGESEASLRFFWIAAPDSIPVITQRDWLLLEKVRLDSLESWLLLWQQELRKEADRLDPEMDSEAFDQLNQQLNEEAKKFQRAAAIYWERDSLYTLKMRQYKRDSSKYERDLRLYESYPVKEAQQYGYWAEESDVPIEYSESALEAASRVAYSVKDFQEYDYPEFINEERPGFLLDFKEEALFSEDMDLFFKTIGRVESVVKRNLFQKIGDWAKGLFSRNRALKRTQKYLPLPYDDYYLITRRYDREPILYEELQGGPMQLRPEHLEGFYQYFFNEDSGLSDVLRHYRSLELNRDTDWDLPENRLIQQEYYFIQRMFYVMKWIYDKNTEHEFKDFLYEDHHNWIWITYYFAEIRDRSGIDRPFVYEFFESSHSPQGYNHLQSPNEGFDVKRRDSSGEVNEESYFPNNAFPNYDRNQTLEHWRLIMQNDPAFSFLVFAQQFTETYLEIEAYKLKGSIDPKVHSLTAALLAYHYPRSEFTQNALMRTAESGWTNEFLSLLQGSSDVNIHGVRDVLRHLFAYAVRHPKDMRTILDLEADSGTKQDVIDNALLMRLALIRTTSEYAKTYLPDWQIPPQLMNIFKKYDALTDLKELRGSEALLLSPEFYQDVVLLMQYLPEGDNPSVIEYKLRVYENYLFSTRLEAMDKQTGVHKWDWKKILKIGLHLVGVIVLFVILYFLIIGKFMKRLKESGMPSFFKTKENVTSPKEKSSSWMEVWEKYLKIYHEWQEAMRKKREEKERIKREEAEREARTFEWEIEHAELRTDDQADSAIDHEEGADESEEVEEKEQENKKKKTFKEKLTEFITNLFRRGGKDKLGMFIFLMIFKLLSPDLSAQAEGMFYRKITIKPRDIPHSRNFLGMAFDQSSRKVMILNSSGISAKNNNAFYLAA